MSFPKGLTLEIFRSGGDTKKKRRAPSEDVRASWFFREIGPRVITGFVIINFCVDVRIVFCFTSARDSSQKHTLELWGTYIKDCALQRLGKRLFTFFSE